MRASGLGDPRLRYLAFIRAESVLFFMGSLQVAKYELLLADNDNYSGHMLEWC